MRYMIKLGEEFKKRYNLVEKRFNVESTFTNTKDQGMGYIILKTILPLVSYNSKTWSSTSR
jgi:hypothetical protein